MSLMWADLVLLKPTDVANEHVRSIIDGSYERVVNDTYNDSDPLECQIYAIALLQLFIQLNFTGPESSISWGPASLDFGGQIAYERMNEPLLLKKSLSIFQSLCGILSSDSIESYTKSASDFVQTVSTPETASLCWWYARALQVHMSTLPEPNDTLALLLSCLLNEKLLTLLGRSSELELVFLLELSRIHIHAQTEHLAIPFLEAAKKLSDFDFVLTGAKAKHTKFQTFYTLSLVLLAKSAGSEESSLETPEEYGLESDLLLEKPHYEQLTDTDVDGIPGAEKVALSENVDNRIFHVAKGDLPERLAALDPNSQPLLSNYDNVQLLLRLAAFKQSSPKSPLVNEEIRAVVNRIVHSGSSNWAVFGRALWERSLLESGSSRTVERGLLQMASLVEEIGLKVKARLMPQGRTTSLALRIRYIHQLPLVPVWTMDAQLAETYMSLGVVKSAIEVYQRLGMVVEEALCYAAIDEEATALKLLEKRVAETPDARAISIMGDIKQDPALWEQAWELGKYPKAKAALSRYFYSPPQGSGLQRNLKLSIEHMLECLAANPLNFDNWYFYGCCGLEAEQFELAAEAFTRCVALDDTHALAWSNLGSALLRLDKVRQAFGAYKRALGQGDAAQRSWRIYENYVIVAARLGEWSEVLFATRVLVEIRKEVDIPVLEKLTHILVSETYEEPLSHFQRSCSELICELIPGVTSDARCWRLAAKVELWRKRPWAVIECHEKAYRSFSTIPTEESFKDAFEACSELVAAYENYGELPGKFGAPICKDWKFKARSCIRSLMSKAKIWEGGDSWRDLESLKEGLSR